MQSTTGGRSPSLPVGDRPPVRHTHAGTVPPDLAFVTPLFYPTPASGWVPDGKGFDWTLVPGDPERIRATAERIRAAL